MPVISMFLGIIVTINTLEKGKHHKPHVHCKYGEYTASYDLEGNLLAGHFPKRQDSFVRAWIFLHMDELQADWNLAMEGKEVFRIDALR